MRHLKPQASYKRKRILDPLFIQLFIWFTFLWVLLLGVTFAVTLQFSRVSLRKKIEGTILSTAISLANSTMIRQALLDGLCPPDLVSYLDDLVFHTDDMDVMSIADRNSRRIYHVVRDRIGGFFVGGDEGRALAGETYIVDGVGTMGPQRRAFCPVRKKNGEIIGFVMVSTTMNRFNALQADIIGAYAKMAVVLTTVSFGFAALLSFLVRKVLHGYNPQSLVRSYLEQNKTLESLDEGLIYVGPKGKIQLVNSAATRMLGLRRELLLGRPLDDILRLKNGKSLLAVACKQRACTRSNLLVTNLPEMQGSNYLGSTLILGDKTEAIQAAEQLAGSRHMISTLRANSHEFMNRLQVITGLLQMGHTEEALSYISNISQLHAEVIAPIVQRIQNSSLAALILGKLNNIRELDIQMTLLPNSNLPVHSDYLSSDELVSLLGNLMENAIEAMNSVQHGLPKNLVIQITEDSKGLLLMVSDTGEGISAKIADQIYLHGFTTKAAEGRGVGMSIVRDIVDHHGAAIEMESEPGAGTTFTVICNKKREGRQEV